MTPNSTGPAEPFPREPIHPDLLAWAQQTFDKEEYLDGVREIEEGRGCTFESLIAEVEARVRGSTAVLQ